MKRLVYALIILLFITTVCIIGSVLICEYCERSREELRFCVSLCEEDNWEAAKSSSGEAVNKWEARRKIMAIFIDHKLLNSITELMHTLPIYANMQSEINFRAASTEIEVILDRIEHMQKLYAENFY